MEENPCKGMIDSEALIDWLKRENNKIYIIQDGKFYSLKLQSYEDIEEFSESHCMHRELKDSDSKEKMLEMWKKSLDYNTA